MPVIGSLGDVLSLCIVINDLRKVISKSRGSSTEYQAIVTELGTLEQVVVQAGSLWDNHECSEELETLRVMVHCKADQCRTFIKGLLERFKKFESSLCEAGSGHFVQDTARKFQWQLSRSDELVKVRSDIIAHYSAINVLLTTAVAKTMKLNNQTLMMRLENSHKHIETLMQDHSRHLTRFEDQINKNTKVIESGNVITSGVAERFERVLKLGNEVKQLMQNIFAIARTVHQTIIDIRDRLPSHLERSLYHGNFVLEDSLGRVFPITTQFINSWEAFDAALEVHFRNIQGHRMVQQKQFILHESTANRDLDRRFPWASECLPGRRIVMCMLFDDYSELNCCPNCYHVTEKVKDIDVKCAECQIWYRRKRALPEPKQPLFDPEPAYNEILSPSEDTITTAKHKLDRTNANEDSVASFRRVRIMCKPSSELFEGRERYFNVENAMLYVNIAKKVHFAHEPKLFHQFLQALERIMRSPNPEKGMDQARQELSPLFWSDPKLRQRFEGFLSVLNEPHTISTSKRQTYPEHPLISRWIARKCEVILWKDLGVRRRWRRECLEAAQAD